MSDHNMVFCELNWSQTSSVNGPSSMKHHSFQNADWELFSELIIKIDYEKIFEHESVDDIWNAFAKALSEVVDLSTPVKNQAKKRRAAPIWETKKVTIARKARNKAERVYLSNKTHANKGNRNKTSKQLKVSVNRAVETFERKLAANTDVKPFWHYVKSNSKVKTSIEPLIKNDDIDLTDNPQECAEVLSSTFSSVFREENLDSIPFAIPLTTDELHGFQFTEDLVARNLANTKNYSSPSPDKFPYAVLKAGGSTMLTTLCKLFQFSLDCGTLPSIWKVAHITPVFIGGYRKDPLNYRPISLTCCICKVIESCIREILWQVWSERSLMNPSQFNFTPNSSCPTSCYNTWMKLLTQLTIARGLMLPTWIFPRRLIRYHLRGYYENYPHWGLQDFF